MSKDIIYREDAIEALNECTDIKGFKYTQMHDALMEIPSVDRPIEEWIAYKGMQPPEFHGKHYCSNCYHTIHLALNGGVYNYCPNCGARMKRSR